MGQEGNKRGKGKPSGGAVEGVPDLRIEYMDLAALVRAPRNPKQHDLGALHTSLSRFGFVNPILLDDRTGQIVAGHGRLDTLQQLKATGGAPPKRVKAVNGSWLIPVIRGVTFDSDTEAEGYLLADNQTTILGGWDDAQLAEMLSDLAAQGAMEGTGFDGDDLDGLLSRLGRFSVDEVEPPALQAGDRPSFQQMTFTLHDEQVEEVKAAITKAKAIGGSESAVNENSNGNALAFICQGFNRG